MKLNNDQVSAAIGIAVGAFVVQHALTYRIGSPSAPGVGFFPLVAGCAMLLFSIFGLGIASWRAASGEGWKPLLKGSEWSRPLFVVVLLLVYAAVLEILGFVITTALLLLLLFLVLERMPLLRALIASLLIAGASHVVFVIALQVQLPKGIWGI